LARRSHDADGRSHAVSFVILAAIILIVSILVVGLVGAAETESKDAYETQSLANRDAHRRAVEAVIWGMPAVNFELLYDATVLAKSGWNQIVYWSRLPDWKNQTLTPNPDTIYLFPFYDTRNGPVVLEVPPADDGSITGTVDDAWQEALEDVGPAGVDQGKGGSYLILPPVTKMRSPRATILCPPRPTPALARCARTSALPTPPTLPRLSPTGNASASIRSRRPPPRRRRGSWTR
jgi:hypothetical protein